MKKNKIFKLIKSLFILLFVTSTYHIEAQQTIEIPNCSNCENDDSIGGANLGSCGSFPYEIDQMDVTGYNLLGFITKNGKVFMYGANDSSIAFPYGNPTSTTNTLNVDTPVNIALPSGVKATKIAMGWAHYLVIGDDGLLYGFGDENHSSINPFGNTTTINEVSFTPVNLPSGVNTVVDVEVWDHDAATMIIGDNGNAYFSGKAADLTSSSDWVEIPRPNPAIHYEKIWATNSLSTDEHLIHGAFYFKMSDGNYYSWGSNVDNALGSTFANNNDTNPALNIGLGDLKPDDFVYVSPLNSAPVRMEALDGLNVKKITFTQDGSSIFGGSVSLVTTPYGHGQAVTVEGDLYTWPSRANNSFVPTVDTLPSLSSEGINSTKANFANYMLLITDAYAFFPLPSNIGATPSNFIRYYQFFPLSDDNEWRLNPRICSNNIKDIGIAADSTIQYILTKEGQIFFHSGSRFASTAGDATIPQILPYGLYDSFNQSPTE